MITSFLPQLLSNLKANRGLLTHQFLDPALRCLKNGNDHYDPAANTKT
jgi:hypothetical protein